MYSTFGSSRLPVIWVVSSSILSCAFPPGAPDLGVVPAGALPVDAVAGAAPPFVGGAAPGLDSGTGGGAVRLTALWAALGPEGPEGPEGTAGEGAAGVAGDIASGDDGCVADVLTPGSRLSTGT